jgi:hypothetical protein
MMRLVLASIVALAAAPHGAASAPHGAGAAHAPAAPPVVVRAEIVAGAGQSVHAYAAPAAAKYLAEFPDLLTVRVVGGAKAGKRMVRFRCVTRGCVFAPEEQPEGVDRSGDDHKDPASYDAPAAPDGKASVRVTLQSDGPAGTYVVRAEPVARKGERTVATSFTLVTR